MANWVMRHLLGYSYTGFEFQISRTLNVLNWSQNQYRGDSFNLAGVASPN